MRVTFVLAHADLSGGVRVVAMYADYLQRHGHTVTVVSRPPRSKTLRERLRDLAHLKWGSSASPTSHVDLLKIPHRELPKFRPVVAEDVPDANVIIATWWKTADWISSFPPEKGKQVYFVQGYERLPEETEAQSDLAWRYPMHRIAVSQWLVDLANTRFGDSHVALVPNGIDLNQFNAPERGKQDTPTVGFVYSTSPFKSVEVITDAIRRARERVPKLRVVAFGANQPSKTLPLPEGTEYTMNPAQTALSGLYASCDAWLWSSRQEGFGLPLLEAMACRTPVIATAAGAAPELLADGGGYLVQCGDSRNMADAIQRLCRLEDAEWRELSNTAYRTAMRYDWEHSAQLFETELVRIHNAEATQASAATPEGSPSA